MKGSLLWAWAGLRIEFLRSLAHWADAELGESHTVKHSRHQNVVSRAINKGNVPDKLIRPLALLHNILCGTAASQKVARSGALGILALVDLCICVAEFDCDIPFKLILEADSLPHWKRGLGGGAGAELHGKLRWAG